MLAVSLCGPAHTNGDLARDGVSKRLLRRATPCRRPKIRTWRRPPPHGMQQAASATSATPHSTMRSPLATRGVAGLFRPQGRGVQANETQVRGTEVEGRRWVPYSGSTPSSSAGNLRREGGLREDLTSAQQVDTVAQYEECAEKEGHRGPWCRRSRGGWPAGRHWAPPAKCVKAHVNLSYSCWVRRVKTVLHASPLASTIHSLSQLFFLDDGSNLLYLKMSWEAAAAASLYEATQHLEHCVRHACLQDNVRHGRSAGPNHDQEAGELAVERLHVEVHWL